MKTSKEYTENLKNKLITRDMLADCLYSVNARAKNARDQICSYYASLEKIPKKKNKNIQNLYVKKTKYYSIKKQLLELLEPSYVIIDDNNNHSYLVYDIGYEHKFCKPICKKNLRKKLLKYPLIYVNDLKTYGDDVNGLVSMHFVNKVVNLIKSGDFIMDNELMLYARTNIISIERQNNVES